MPDKSPMSSSSRFKRLKDAYMKKMRNKYAKKSNANPDAYSFTKEEKQKVMEGLKKLVRETDAMKMGGGKNPVGREQTWSESRKGSPRRKR